MEGKTIIRFTDLSTEFLARNALFGDAMLGLMAASVETHMKMDGKVPFKPHGGPHLRTDIRHRRLGALNFIVTVGETTASAYAAAQEAGRAGSRIFKNYTTPGTGKGFFKAAVDATRQNERNYIETAKSIAGIRNY